jgi:hypothetical protein
MPHYYLKTDRLRLLGFYEASSPEEAEQKFKHITGKLLKTMYDNGAKRFLARRLARNDFEVEEFVGVGS